MPCDSPTVNAAAPPRFIVADDELLVGSFVARVIVRTYRNAEITIVANGQAALQAYEQQGADLIVTDYNMPQMNGLSLVRGIRAKNATIPIVLISGVGDSAPEAVAIGATQFLNKPFTIGQFVAVLTTLLPLL